jgi:hypothetical protein
MARRTEATHPTSGPAVAIFEGNRLVGNRRLDHLADWQQLTENVSHTGRRALLLSPAGQRAWNDRQQAVDPA